MTQFTRPDPDRASAMMWDACSGGGSAWITCRCGTDWYDRKLDEDDDPIYYRYVELAGHVFVEDCEGCSRELARYENWIWNNRNEIRDYLKIRVDQQLRWAEQEQLLNRIAGVDRRV